MSVIRLNLVKINKKVDFVVITDKRVKIKETEKREKYLDLAREQRKQWSIKVSVIPVVVGAPG